MPHVCLFRWVFAACLGLAGCASELEPDTLAGSADGDVCDIAELGCQSRVLAMVAAMRGKPIPPAPRYELLPLSAASSVDRPIVTQDAEKLRSRARWDAVYAALQMLPAVQSSRYAEAHRRDAQLDKAHYWYGDRSVVIGPRSNVLPRDPRAEMGTLAHELTHYMQDLELGILRLYELTPDDADAQASVRALIEGEASYVGWSVQSQLSGLSPTATEWSAHFDRLDASYLASVSGSSTPLTTALDLMPYSVGGRHIADLWQRAGRAAVDALSQHVPQAFAEWLQPAGTAPAWPVRVLACSSPVAPQGYELRDQTQLGSLGALAFLATGFAEDLEVTAPLRADSLFLYTPIADKGAKESEQLYANQASPIIAAWLLRFDTQSAAQAFEAAIPIQSAHDRTFTRSKNVVALAVSTDPAQPAAAMLEALECD